MAKKRLCITIDLENDFAGLIGESYEACDPAKLDRLFRIFRSHGIRPTVFVVGRLLERRLPVVEALRDVGAEFGLHSYSHQLTEPNSRDEVVRGKEAFKAYFGEYPRGYRAPQGRIEKEDLKLLAAEGFAYDSSVFPSFWPAPKYLLEKRHPHRDPESGLAEFPFATIPARLIVSQSWLKLLGWRFWKNVLRFSPLPDTFVFDSHLHDFVTPENGLGQLSPVWRRIYLRNSAAPYEIFESFVELMKGRGYEFALMSELETPP